MRQKNQALIDAMETQGYDVKDIAQKVGVTLPAVYNWLRGGKPRAPQRAKLTEILGIDVENAAKVAVREQRAAALRTAVLEKHVAKYAKANGAEPEPAKENSMRLEAGPMRPVTVRVSGDGLLLEVQVRRETATQVIEVLGFKVSG
jgi:transcriptional regulator with XRE-family HTH domain